MKYCTNENTDDYSEKKKLGIDVHKRFQMDQKCQMFRYKPPKYFFFNLLLLQFQRTNEEIIEEIFA